jgi:5-methylcytosine-specific restriction endonuclease McrA
MRSGIFRIRKHECTVCGRKFKSEIEIQAHKKVEHELKGP